jgi:hypothetical protein
LANDGWTNLLGTTGPIIQAHDPKRNEKEPKAIRPLALSTSRSIREQFVGLPGALRLGKIEIVSDDGQVPGPDSHLHIRGQ